jgi:hypothetical protein
MSLNLVSPGVKVREVDLTIGRVDAANEQVGAIAGPFERGPVNVPILIETEQDLLKTFGKPNTKDAQYDYWLSASSYLSYGGVLRVLRSDEGQGLYLNNANAGVSIASTSVKIKSYEDYENNFSSATDWYYAAKNPGRWSNKLKVCTIDGAGDQIISGIATAGVTVGMGVTQKIDGRVNAGSGSTSTYDGFIRGIITEVGDGQISVKITDKVSTAGTSTSAEYAQGGSLAFIAPTSVSTTTTTGIGTTAGVIDTAFDASISGINTTSAAAGIDQNIEVGDVVTVTGGNSTVPTGTKVVAVGVGTVFVDQTITGISTAGDGAVFTFTRSSSTTVSDNEIRVKDASAAGIATYTTASTKDWYNEQTLGLTNSEVYWKSIAEKPGTSQYASERSAKNDEIHVVVVDDTGAVTGVAGNIVEKFTYLSKSSDGVLSPTEAVYYKNSVARLSEYVYAGKASTGVASGLTAGVAGAFTASGVGNWGGEAQETTFAVEGSKTYNLTGGENYTSAGGFAATLADIVTSYEVLKNPAEYPINFLINGPSGGDSIFESQAKANKLIEIANIRKDCIACISPHRDDVVNVSDSDTQTNNIIRFFDGCTSSSYAVFDSGFKYTFDRFNNEFRYIACNADIAGLMARTSINQFPWFSPAGSSRGAINGAVKLAYNPSQAQRDQIYPKRINPVVAQPGSGIVLFGDKTALSFASAFDRINVRRLFLTIEDSIERAAKDQLFEFNDVITRSNFVNIVEPFLRDVKAKRGINEFLVICDETNNTPDIVDSNQFRADIFVKPARSINFIGLTFVATRTGVSFEEVVGNV